MADWGFYGRQDELEKVRAVIDKSGFRSVLIRGGRLIGKTELMQKLRDEPGRQAQILIFELKDPNDENQERANRRLIREARLARPAVKIPRRTAYFAGDPQQYFIRIIEELLAQGAVVCLDEFQMAKPMHLEGALKLLIDRSRSTCGPRPPGKLIMMGSHQQRVLEMFGDREPLFGREGHVVLLRQWPLSTVFGMAEKHGFLQYPGRMLTLWTAFGGVPGRWRNFADQRDEPGRLADMAAWDDDDAWRKAFLGWHRQLLEDNPRERFDHRAFVELAPKAREALLWLALPRPKAEKFRDFPEALRKPPKPIPVQELVIIEDPRKPPEMALGPALDMMRDHLGLVECNAEFMIDSHPKYRIADNSTLFQINVYREMFAQAGRQKIGAHLDTNPEALALRRLETLEGHALERMAASWLASQPGVTWSEHAVWRDARTGESMPDIDVMGFRGRWKDPAPVLVMAGCKRESGAHETTTLEQQFEKFLAVIRAPAGDRLRDMARERLLFSPAFTTAERERYRDAGFRAVGIHDMPTTPLHEAALRGEAARIARLVAAGADVNAGDVLGNMPLHHAAGRGTMQAVTNITTLIELGADPNARNTARITPLHVAAIHGNTAASAALIAGGADPDTTARPGIEDEPATMAAEAPQQGLFGDRDTPAEPDSSSSPSM